jgi:hypothetical protein
MWVWGRLDVLLLRRCDSHGGCLERDPSESGEQKVVVHLARWLRVVGEEEQEWEARA